MELKFESMPIEKDEGTGALLGHAGFIKTVEDLYEAMLCSVPGVKFGIVVRSEGNDEGLRTQAERTILKIAAVTLHESAIRSVSIDVSAKAMIKRVCEPKLWPRSAVPGR